MTTITHAPQPSERYKYYVEQCQMFHAAKKTFSGRGCLKHATRLLELAEEFGATSALDYGCGKGSQYSDAIFDGQTIEQKLGFEVAKFDPAVPQFQTPPSGKFDLVWCTDVLEHIPAEDIDYVVSELAKLTRKALFVTVGQGPAKKTLLNGENTHITQMPAEWWQERFAPIKRRRGANKIHLELMVE